MSGPPHWAVVIAVVAVWMVQMAVHQIVNVIAMRDGGVAAIGAVLVALVVAAASVVGSASGGIGGVYIQAMLFHVVALLMVQMAVVQIIHVALVLDSGVAAARPMNVLVISVTASHD